MILYLDATALVKVYLHETHSEQVRRRVAEAAVVATHAVAYVEVRSALARRCREGHLVAADRDAVVARLDADWSSWALVTVDERLAGDLAARHGLRALDAIHLAAALTLRDAAGGTAVAFCSFDARQSAAAAEEGLAS